MQAPPPQSRRDRVVAVLRASSEPMGIAGIADELGVHPNTVRFHLDALVATGRVERVPGTRSGPGRPPLGYRMSRAMNPGGPSNYRLLAQMLTGHLAATSRTPAATAAELGRAWGPALIPRTRTKGRPSKTQALTRMVEALDELGFEPEPHRGARATQIRLRHCPFLELVDGRADVICAVHLGLMQGALAAIDGPVTVDRLEAFVEPDLCVAHLERTGRPSTSV